jgi:threonine aldolase
MDEIATFAREKGVAIHLDGARLFNASIASGIDARDFSRRADSVSICLSKGLGAPVGSCLSGDRDFIDRARRVRKILGGGMRQVGILAAAGIYALEHNIPRLAEDHANARRLAEGIADLPGFKVEPKHVETNIIIIHITDEERDIIDVIEELKERGVQVVIFGERTLRAVTHLNVSAADIDRAIAVFHDCFGT